MSEMRQETKSDDHESLNRNCSQAHLEEKILTTDHLQIKYKDRLCAQPS